MPDHQEQNTGAGRQGPGAVEAVGAEGEPWYRRAFRGDYLSLYTHRNEVEAEQLARLAQRVTGLPAGGRIADIPCGGGRHMRAFRQMGWITTGLDLSTDLLRAAMDVSREAPLARADIRRLPLRSGSFDVVANIFTSLGYFESDGENVQAVEELARLVGPGGWLLIDFFDAAYVREHLVARSVRTTAEGWSVEEMREIVEAEGGKAQQVDRVRKRIRIKKSDDSGGMEHFEEVALLDRVWFERALKGAGFEVVESFAGYDGRVAGGGQESSAGAAPRLILFCRRDGVR